jgi:cyclopropane fatty-acyl-phospholipid synthase-like methyltransferase
MGVKIMLKKKMEEIYKTIPLENIPWNLEKPPKILRELIEEGKIKPCKAIELGCGIGNYVMYLAGKGFDVTGVDFSETAIEIARNTAGQRGIRCTFVAADVLSDIHEISTSFDFVFDWELLHHIFPEERERYIKNVHRLMNPRGYYLSVCFSEESEQFCGSGKYRKTPLGTTLCFSS